MARAWLGPAGVELWISRSNIRAKSRREFMRLFFAQVSVCTARTRYLKPDSHFHPPTMLHFLSPAEWRLPPPHTQLRSTPPGRSKPSVYGPMAARSVGSIGKSSGSRTSCRACSDVSRWSAEYKYTSPSDGRSVTGFWDRLRSADHFLQRGVDVLHSPPNTGAAG